MKGLACLVAGTLAVASTVGCVSHYKGAGGYSCELTSRGGEVIAENGKKSATLTHYDDRVELTYKNMTAEEALHAVDACLTVFGKMRK